MLKRQNGLRLGLGTRAAPFGHLWPISKTVWVCRSLRFLGLSPRCPTGQGQGKTRRRLLPFWGDQLKVRCRGLRWLRLRLKPRKRSPYLLIWRINSVSGKMFTISSVSLYQVLTIRRLYSPIRVYLAKDEAVILILRILGCWQIFYCIKRHKFTHNFWGPSLSQLHK